LFDTENYVKQARVTLSGEVHLGLVHPNDIDHLFANFTKFGQIVDKRKRALFYGKPISEETAHKAGNCAANLYNGELRTYNILHMIMGLITETAEFIEGFQKGDAVNVKEELGDILWYLAILASEYDLSLEDCAEANIAKLRARFGDKFTAHDAINRNVDKERTILENSVNIADNELADKLASEKE